MRPSIFNKKKLPSKPSKYPYFNKKSKKGSNNGLSISKKDIVPQVNGAVGEPINKPAVSGENINKRDIMCPRKKLPAGVKTAIGRLQETEKWKTLDGLILKQDGSLDESGFTTLIKYIETIQHEKKGESNEWVFYIGSKYISETFNNDHMTKLMGAFMDGYTNCEAQKLLKCAMEKIDKPSNAKLSVYIAELITLSRDRITKDTSNDANLKTSVPINIFGWKLDTQKYANEIDNKFIGHLTGILKNAYPEFRDNTNKNITSKHSDEIGEDIVEEISEDIVEEISEEISEEINLRAQDHLKTKLQEKHKKLSEAVANQERTELLCNEITNDVSTQRNKIRKILIQETIETIETSNKVDHLKTELQETQRKLSKAVADKVNHLKTKLQETQRKLSKAVADKEQDKKRTETLCNEIKKDVLNRRNEIRKTLNPKGKETSEKVEALNNFKQTMDKNISVFFKSKFKHDFPLSNFNSYLPPEDNFTEATTSHEPEKNSDEQLVEPATQTDNPQNMNMNIAIESHQVKTETSRRTEWASRKALLPPKSRVKRSATSQEKTLPGKNQPAELQASGKPAPPPPPPKPKPKLKPKLKPKPMKPQPAQANTDQTQAGSQTQPSTTLSTKPPLPPKPRKVNNSKPTSSEGSSDDEFEDKTQQKKYSLGDYTDGESDA